MMRRRERPPTVKRKRPTYRERYAALICGMQSADGTFIIDQKWARSATTDQIIERFENRGKGRQWDHSTALGLGGTNHPTNFDPLKTSDHGVKTKRDIKAIAKTKRIIKDTDRHDEVMLAKVGQAPEATPERKPRPRRPWASRPIPGSKNTPFKVRLTKDGPKVVRRDGAR